MQTCNQCFIEKDETEFYKEKRRDGSFRIRLDCKQCGSNRANNWNKRNLDKHSFIQRSYRERHGERLREEYRKRAPERYDDPYYKTSQRIRGNIRGALRRYLNGFKIKSGCLAEQELGCSIKEFKEHLQSQFKTGMTWENWGYSGWHIDHIVPLCDFDLDNPEDYKKAVHYTNIQPLWAGENMKKSRYSNSRISREVK